MSEAGDTCVADEEKLEMSERRRGLLEGRVFGEPEHIGLWAQTVVGQDKGLPPTRRREVSSRVGLERLKLEAEGRAGRIAWVGHLEPGDELAGGLLREEKS